MPAADLWPTVDDLRVYINPLLAATDDTANVQRAYDYARAFAVNHCGWDRFAGPPDDTAASGLLELGSWSYASRNRGDGPTPGAEAWRRRRAIADMRGGRAGLG